MFGAFIRGGDTVFTKRPLIEISADCRDVLLINGKSVLAPDDMEEGAVIVIIDETNEYAEHFADRVYRQMMKMPPAPEFTGVQWHPYGPIVARRLSSFGYKVALLSGANWRQ